MSTVTGALGIDQHNALHAIVEALRAGRALTRDQAFAVAGILEHLGIAATVADRAPADAGSYAYVAGVFESMLDRTRRELGALPPDDQHPDRPVTSR